MFTSQDSRIIYSGELAQKQLLAGAKQLADIIRLTVGPSGKTVMIQHHSPGLDPEHTKDGYTVAARFKAKLPVHEMGASAIRAASRETVKEAGDGTSTTAIMMLKLMEQGLRLVHTSHNPAAIKHGIRYSMDRALAWIDENRFMISYEDRERIHQIAAVSANGEAVIADVVTEAVCLAGEDGHVIIQQGRMGQDEIVHVPGTKYKRGFISPVFANSTKTASFEAENCRVLIIEGAINTRADLQQLLNQLNESSSAKQSDFNFSTPTVVIARGYSELAMSNLGRLRINRGLPLCVCINPQFGNSGTSALIDLSFILGARIVGDNSEIPLKLARSSKAFGKAGRVIIDGNSMTFIDGQGKKNLVDERVEYIRQCILKVDSDYERDALEQRIAKIRGSIVTIKVGGSSEADIGERLHRFEDSLHAAKGVLESGFVTGGGSGLLKIARALERELQEESFEHPVYPETGIREGIKLAIEALKEPFLAICENCSIEGRDYLREVSEAPAETGFNARTGVVCDMIQEGIIDPGIVVSSAVKNAFSGGAQMITAEVAMAFEDQWEHAGSILTQ